MVTESVMVYPSNVRESFSRAKERRGERRQQILDTASTLFSEHGYENVTLRAIAQQLGYAHNAMYRYFPDKASLLAEICRETFDRLMVELEARASEAATPEDRLIAVSLAFVRFGLAHPHHYQAMFSGSVHQYGAELKKQVDAMGKPMFGWLMQTFSTGAEAARQNQGTRMLDANTWWIALFGVTHVLISSCEMLGSESSEEILKRHVQVMWEGFKGISGAARATSHHSVGAQSTTATLPGRKQSRRPTKTERRRK